MLRFSWEGHALDFVFVTLDKVLHYCEWMESHFHVKKHNEDKIRTLGAS
jgi:hypothetical protein